MNYSIVTPVFNRIKYLPNFIEKYEQIKQHYNNISLTILDDNSTDGTAEYLRGRKDVQVVNGDGECWWAEGTNIAIDSALKAGNDFIITLNDNTIVDLNWFKQIYNHSLNDIKTVHCSNILFNNSNVVWSAGSSYHNSYGCLHTCNLSNINISHLSKIFPETFFVDSSPGNGVCYHRSVFEKWGFFPQNKAPHYHADTLYNYLLSRRGIRTKCVFEAQLQNDISDHIKQPTNPLFNIKSPHYLPAVYEVVSCREGIINASKSVKEYYNCFKEGINNETNCTFDPNFVASIYNNKPLFYKIINTASITFKIEDAELWYKLDFPSDIELFFMDDAVKINNLFVISPESVKLLDTTVLDNKSIKVNINTTKFFRLVYF
jgi:hypothetical protein